MHRKCKSEINDIKMPSLQRRETKSKEGSRGKAMVATGFGNLFITERIYKFQPTTSVQK